MARRGRGSNAGMIGTLPGLISAPLGKGGFRVQVLVGGEWEESCSASTGDCVWHCFGLNWLEPGWREATRGRHAVEGEG